jgi:predicted nucleotidyltransferase
METATRAKQNPTLIFETVHGSTAYNLARAGSDVDLKGIVVGPREWYFGMETAPEQVDLSPDHVRYELRKFMRLAVDANPTVIELLFTSPEHHRCVTSSGELLLQHRDAFLSKRIADRFSGYALAQLERIRSHRSYLLAPPSHAPTRAEFDLPERTVIPADQLAAAESLLVQGDLEGADASPNFLELLARERRYKSALKGWQSYQTWLRTRNPKRSDLEAKFGYDTKHAMHLVRLQRMAIETLSTGHVNVTRDDREELLAIRDGALSFDQLETQTDAIEQQLRAAASMSLLPDHPNENFINNLCISIIETELQC